MAGVCSKSKGKYDLEMSCCLGNHQLNKPKLLPCHHSFCTECIKAKVRPDKKEFTCPKCQLSIPLTEQKVDQLPDNVLFHIMQEARGGKAECVMCKFENKKSLGTFQCLDCGEVTCDACKGGHTKTSFTRFHKQVPIKDIQDGKYKNEVQAAKQPLCDTHSKQSKPMLLDYYCEKCHCLGCQLCVIKEHQPRGHACKTIDEIHDDKTTAFNYHVTKLLELNQLDEEFADVLEKSQGQNKELKVALENEVYQRATRLIEVIERVKEDKLQQISGHFQTEDTSIQATLNETKNRMIRTDSIVTYTQVFLEHSVKSEFLQHENELRKTLTNHLQQKYERTLKTSVLEIGDAQIEKMKDLITQSFGEIRVKRKELSSCRGGDAPRELMEEPKVLFSVGSGIGNASDMTVTENGDIVAVPGSTIQVYNSDGKPKERIKCSQLQNAWNVVARGATLYVSNKDANGNILVMDLKGNVKKIITLPQIDQRYSYKGLAVDDQGNVFISSTGTHAIYKCEPNETNAKVFIPQGSHPDLKGPWYLCVTPKGEVVVSNGSSNTVQVYNRNGEFSWQYKGQGDNKLKNPHGVCCDMDGNIYIANCNCNTIEIIKDAVFQIKLKIKEFADPYGIALDKDGNIVCSNNYYFGSDSMIMKLKVWV